jgi:biotin synthase-related radical SAM superfamily protein
MVYVGYRVDRRKESLDEILTSLTAINSMFKKGQLKTSVIIGELPKHRIRADDYISFLLEPEDSDDKRNLVLLGGIEDLDGSIYEGKTTDDFRNETTVGDEGLKLIERYGVEEHKPILRGCFRADFPYPIIKEDSGIHYGLMLEFFLGNLHLLRHPELE